MAARRHRQARLRNRVDQSGWWEVLGHLAREHRPGKDEAYRTVLYQRLAFEYNGEIWYDVHPLLGEELLARGLLGPSA
jgi:hypothetical protein